MHTAQTRTVRTHVSLPFGFFAGPILWAVMIIVGYGLASLARQIGENWPVYLEIAITGVIVLIAAFLAYSAWKAVASKSMTVEANVSEESPNFWGISGFYMSAIFFLVILVTFVAGLFLSPLPIITMLMP